MARKKRAPITTEIESLSHEGRGVARVDGKTVFVRGALPGESVSARITRRRASFDEAVAEEILSASPQRIVPKCVHATICGGCSLQHLPAEAQLQHKEAVLFELLEHHAHAHPARLTPIAGPSWGYRRKARLGVKYVPKKGGVLVGFREQASPYIAEMSACEVLHPSVGTRITDLRDLIGELSIRDRVPQIEVSVSDEITALVFRHLDPFSEKDLERLAEFESSHNVEIYLQPGGLETVHALSASPSPLQYLIQDLNLHFEVTDFTQVNMDINRAMIGRVMELLDVNENDRVLDLFCGLGNFSLPIALRAGSVAGIEGSEQAVIRARDNAVRNGIDNASFEIMNLADEVSVRTISMAGVTKVLLDPPRTGAEAVVRHLDMTAIEKIVYVSCNPVTLARDANALIRDGGFDLLSAGVMDMFPHTAHVESLAVFEKH